MGLKLSGRKKRFNLIPVLPLFFILFGLFSCFSFKVEVPLEPECVIDTVVIVKAIPDKDALEGKIAAEPAAVTDANLYALIKVLQVSKPLKLQWLWYSPENKLLRQSKVIEINAKGKYLSYFAAWDVMPQSYYADKKGRWTVVITVDGSFLARNEFEIK